MQSYFAFVVFWQYKTSLCNTAVEKGILD